TVAQGLRHHGCLVQKLIALKHQFFLPHIRIRGERKIHPTLTCLALLAVLRSGNPIGKPRQYMFLEHRRWPSAPIFPRKETIPILPGGSLWWGRGFFPREAEIRHRNNVPPGGIGPLSISEGIELFSVPQRMMGLVFNPCA